MKFSSYWPLREARLLTVFISLIAILFTYWAGYEASGDRFTALLAGGLIAFLPQFTFRGTHISNDAMLVPTSAAATYYLIRLMRRNFTWTDGCLAAACTAFAILSKINAIIFVPVLAVVLIVKPGSLRQRIQRCSLLLITAAIVAPWSIRNQILYGDFLARHMSKALLKIYPLEMQPKYLWSDYFVREFPRTMYQSLIGEFGWMDITLPQWVYYFFGLLGLAAVAGLLSGVRRRAIGIGLSGMLVGLVLLSIAAAIDVNMTFTQPQGRYLFPALTAMAVLTALGLTQFMKIRAAKMTYLALFFLFATNVYALTCELVEYWRYDLGPNPKILDTLIPTNALNVFKGTPAEPLLSGAEYGQTFVARHDHLAAVQIQIATYQKVIPAGLITLHLRADAQSKQDIATSVFAAKKIREWDTLTLEFPEISHSAGKSYYFGVTTQGIPAGYSVTMLITPEDEYPQGRFYAK